jgi:predicted dehydrogenase
VSIKSAAGSILSYTAAMELTEQKSTGLIRWGILGAGSIAAIVGKVIIASKDSEVVAVGSASSGRARDLAAMLNVPRSYASYKELVADPNVDIVYVATTNAQHHEHALLALEAGKHVLVEKAFALNARQANDIMAKARRHGLFCMEAMPIRFKPLIRQAADIASSGQIGELISVRADLSSFFPYDPSSRIYDPALGGGALLDLGVYVANFCWIFLGRPETVHTTGNIAATGVDVTAAMQWGYEGGRFAQMACTMLGRNPMTGLVSGTDGWILIGERLHRPSDLSVHVGDETKIITGERSSFEDEIAEVEQCLRAGLVESRLAPLDETIEIMGLVDSARAELGVRYAADGD